MKKKITLYSLNEKEYPNTEIEVEVIENVSSQISALTQGDKFLAIKKVEVQARQAKTGEQVDTRPRIEVDGKVYTLLETTQTVSIQQEQDGAMIVSNPDGEEYIISSYEKFNRKYEKTQKGYMPIDDAKHFICSNGNYLIKTKKREYVVLKGSYFCVQDKDNIYGVTNSAFERTYTADSEQISIIEQKIDAIKTRRNVDVGV